MPADASPSGEVGVGPVGHLGAPLVGPLSKVGSVTFVTLDRLGGRSSGSVDPWPVLESGSFHSRRSSRRVGRPQTSPKGEFGV